MVHDYASPAPSPDPAPDQSYTYMYQYQYAGFLICLIAVVSPSHCHMLLMSIACTDTVPLHAVMIHPGQATHHNVTNHHTVLDRLHDITVSLVSRQMIWTEFFFCAGKRVGVRHQCGVSLLPWTVPFHSRWRHHWYLQLNWTSNWWGPIYPFRTGNAKCAIYRGSWAPAS